MQKIKLICLLLVLYTCSILASNQHDALTLSASPKRIVVLEFSFVDALASINVSPIGVADDKDTERVIPEVRAIIKPWTSVGMRSQPSIEAIAQLNPDLIIADKQRHSAIYEDLSKIASTLLLKSRGESYQENLQSALKIGVALNKEQQMKDRINQHEAVMSKYQAKFLQQDKVQFAVVTDKGMWMHGPLSYAGGVIDALGLSSPISQQINKPYIETSLEQLLKINPDWLLIGPYKNETVIDEWEKNPLFRMLSAAQKKQIIKVSPALWSLNRGMIAAEIIAKDLDTLLNSQ